MNNSEIAEILSSFAKLLELHGGNEFKIKSFNNAAFKINKLAEPISNKSIDELEQLQGIGKTLAKVIFDILHTETFIELEKLIHDTPKGVIDIMRIKGIGPKKVAYIWKELGIDNLGELFYACKENRLAQAKGFGLKTQQQIIQQIEFMQSSANKLHYFKAAAIANLLMLKLKKVLHYRIEICGEIRRNCEVIENIELLVGNPNTNTVYNELKSSGIFYELSFDESKITANFENTTIYLFLCHPDNFAYYLMLHTGNEAHLKQINFNNTFLNAPSEKDIYLKSGVSFVEPELREGLFEIEQSKKLQNSNLITYTDLKGALHNHSNWSDGLASIEEMVNYCIKQGWQYFGIADHSKAAFYANGLSDERVFMQINEIEKIQLKFKNFKIFKGIECDILNNGLLDYSNDVLKVFDYVVASVHSNLKMDEDKAMMRLIKAIENPYITILGHLTGRLLLLREGYAVNHQKIIDACAANGVCIELNANPYRLDIDWRYIPYALEKNVLISINPDAHDTESLHDMQWGIATARKGLLTPDFCLNAKSTEDLQTFFNAKK